MKKSIFIILIFLIYILPLGVRPLMMPDEYRYAEIPREMIASNDFAVPHLNGVRYFEKPPFGYWFNAVSMLVFGENAFSARLPSAISVLLSGFILFFLVKRFSKEYDLAIFTTIVFITCLEVFGIGTFSVLDTIFSFLITVSITSFFLYFTNRKKRFLILFGLFSGLSFLTKGFLAFAIPVIVIVPFILWEKKWKDLFIIPWIPLLSATLISLPWSIIVHLREFDFWNYFFWTEHIKRFSAEDAQHLEPIWYFIPVIIGGTFPWTFVSASAILGWKKDLLKDTFTKFTICWFIFPLLFFSIAKGKLLTYILPCFPPLAFLLAKGILNYLKSGKKKSFDNGALAMSAFMLIPIAILIINYFTPFPDGIKIYNSNEFWKWAFLLSAFIFWAISSLISAYSPSINKKLTFYAISPICLFLAYNFAVPDIILDNKSAENFLKSHIKNLPENSLIVSGDDPMHAVCWFSKRNDIYLFVDASEISYGLNYPDAKHRFLNLEKFLSLISENKGVKPVALICKKHLYESYSPKLPIPKILDTNNYFIFALF
ncbi:MAG: phospholipid carrier-dependent glycosyltransferase [Desulfobacterales bacterium]|nr:phospholipid carrier-dependent glycosyltransferase [Desulfobacterales bacterium]